MTRKDGHCRGGLIRPRVSDMGEDVEAQEFSRADRTRYREKVHRCLDTFARMLSEHQFDTDDPMTGLEVEFNLVDELGDPALKNAEALAAIADPDFQTELGRYNIEFNVPPRGLSGDSMTELETMLRASLDHAESRANETGAEIIMIGILARLPSSFFQELQSKSVRSGEILIFIIIIIIFSLLFFILLSNKFCKTKIY